MIRKSLKELQKMMKIENSIESFEEVMIHGVTIDSRKVANGNLFIPFKGEKVDGHQFVEGAIQNGASAVLWQKDVPNPPKKIPLLIVEDTLKALQELAQSYRNEQEVSVVGITGSNGKTTTKDMVASLLSLKYKVQKTEGNFNNHIGLPLTILALEEDTEVAVLEMGMSNLGEIEFLSKLARPDVAIITNIGESHLQDLGSRERIAEAKLEIMEGLADDGVLVYHGDEPLLQERMKHHNGSAKLQTFGRLSRNTLYPTYIEQDSHGSVFRVNGVNQEYQLPILGTHNILNALAAMLAAHHLGLSFEEMNEGFATLKVTNMRMELVEGAHGERIINDAYNASPTSMRAAIDLISGLPGYKRKIVVLGDMLELGVEEEAFHFEMGRMMDPKKIDYVFTYGRLGKWIAKGTEKSFPSERVFSFLDKEEMIQEIKNWVNEDTIILIKASRGMALEEVAKSLQKK